MHCSSLSFSQPGTQSSVRIASNGRRNLFLILIFADCGNLTDPASGQVNNDGTTFGHTATYSCNTGYNLVGDSTRTCQATGVWSGSAPTCQGTLLKGDLILSIHAYK